MLPEFRDLVAALIAAHFLADFVFQTRKTAENKSNIFVLQTKAGGRIYHHRDVHEFWLWPVHRVLDQIFLELLNTDWEGKPAAKLVQFLVS